MQLLETVSLLTPDGYFYKAENCHGGLLPGSAVNLAPPKLNLYESARINDAKDGWIIEEDLTDYTPLPLILMRWSKNPLFLMILFTHTFQASNIP